jgi:membrane-associated phospholipid phosphatase
VAEPVNTKELTRGARFGVRAVLAGVALGLVAVPFGLLLFLVEERWPPLLHADNAARDDLHRLAVGNRAFVVAMEALSTIGSWWVYLLGFTAVTGWLLWRRLTRLAVFVALTVAVNPLLNELVKVAVHRARPVLTDPVGHADGASFPSGHAQAAMVGYSVLLLVFLPVLRGPARSVAIVAAALMVLAIGFSRVALGVHYVSDVLAGYVLGAAWVASMIALFNTWRRERRRPSTDPAQGLEPESAHLLDPGNPRAGAPQDAPPDSY